MDDILYKIAMALLIFAGFCYLMALLTFLGWV